MVQSYPDIASSDDLTSSRQRILDRDDAIKSNFSGTSFPTTNLIVGMECYRTDLGIKYVLTSTSPTTWVQVADTNKTGDYLEVGQNLGDLDDPSAARANLELGSAAVQDDTYFLKVGSDLSDLSDVVSARDNLGLGTSAVKNTGTADGNVPLLTASGLPAVNSHIAKRTRFKEIEPVAVAVDTAIVGSSQQGIRFNVNTNTGDITMTLPASMADGYVNSFLKTTTDVNHAIITAQGAEKIYAPGAWGVSSIRLRYPGQAITLYKLGTSWFVFSSHGAVGAHQEYIKAIDLTLDPDDAPTDRQSISMGSGRPAFEVIRMQDGTKSAVQFQFYLPPSWNGGPINVYPVWTFASGASSFNAVFGAAIGIAHDNDTLDINLNSSTTEITDTADTYTEQRIGDAITPTLQGDVSAPGVAYVKLYRDPTNVADDLNAYVYLIGVIVEFIKDQEADYS